MNPEETDNSYPDPSMVIVWGSSTGFTEAVATLIHEQLTSSGLKVDMVDIADCRLQKLAGSYEVLIVGAPTWHIGELQDDWERCFDDLADLNLAGKRVALFGCGDARGYPDTFQDAMGILWQRFEAAGAELLGRWPVDGYDILASKALTEDGRHFVGLAIDEHTQSDLTGDRVECWSQLIRWELGLEGVEIPAAPPLPSTVSKTKEPQRRWLRKLWQGLELVN